MAGVVSLVLRLTERCNLNCQYCYASSGSDGREMSLEIAKKSIGLFAKSGNKLKIQFTGGEPLLCPGRIAEIYDYVCQQGIQATFAIQTNGTLFDERRLQLLKKMKCRIGISLDGLGVANRLRQYPDGRASDRDVIDGIRALARSALACNLNAVITAANQRDLHRLMDLAAYLGNVGGIGLELFRPLGRGRHRQGLCPDLQTLEQDIQRFLLRRQTLAQLGRVIRQRELDKIWLRLRHPATTACYCDAQTGCSVAVDTAGALWPCSSLIGQAGYRLGHVASDFSLEAPTEPQRQIIKNLNTSQGACLICPDRTLCRGGCPAGRLAGVGQDGGDCLLQRTVIKFGRRCYDPVSLSH